MRVEEHYRKKSIPSRFFIDLMMLNVPGLFEGKDVQSYPKLFVDHINSVGPPRSLRPILVKPSPFAIIL